ncbi:MAG TPA: hypothetical protein VM328_12410, partial [Fimbriimonadaceae bacterium]|nr:hypothetical protein [Fimbriimonadaceae bacterium]
LDVKAGSGAFMKDLDRARELASLLKETARRCGKAVRIAITDMDQPLGSCVGNALEVREAFDALQGRGPARFRSLCLQLAALTLEASGMASDREAALIHAEEALASGKAIEKAEQWLRAQGAAGVPGEADLPRAPVVTEMLCEQGPGFAARVDAETVGQCVVDLGGGRRRKDDPVDLSVGVEVLVEVGSGLEPGTPLFRVHARDQASAQAAQARLLSAVRLSDQSPPLRPLIHDVL